MNTMRIILLIFLSAVFACAPNEKKVEKPALSGPELVAMLDEVFQAEQIPIRQRDSVFRIHGYESPKAQPYDELYKKNHAINEQKITALLDNQGWPAFRIIGEQGNLTICNVLQHSSLDVREKYLPMMRQAVSDKELSPRFLVRAEDRIATDKGKLQIYGGQMKYYPETKTFNVWPVYDPENINKRRAAIGLGTIEDHLRERFDFEWNLEEQIKRTEAFLAAKNNQEAED